MSVANSGIFQVVHALEIELAEVADNMTQMVSGIDSALEQTEIIYNWQFEVSTGVNGRIVPAGALPAGVYTATGFVTVSDPSFTYLSINIADQDGTALTPFTACSFIPDIANLSHLVDEYTATINFYFQTEEDNPSIELCINLLNPSPTGKITASVQLKKANETYPPPIGPL